MPKIHMHWGPTDYIASTMMYWFLFFLSSLRGRESCHLSTHLLPKYPPQLRKGSGCPLHHTIACCLPRWGSGGRWNWNRAWSPTQAFCGDGSLLRGGSPAMPMAYPSLSQVLIKQLRQEGAAPILLSAQPGGDQRPHKKWVLTLLF